MAKMKDLALGSYEAASVLGVHWTRARLMAEAGKIISRPLASSVTDPSHKLAIYSLEDCERDYREYEDRVAASGGKHYRRPRAWLHLRPVVLKKLAALKHPIEYADAIGMQEAMEILRITSTSQLPRIIADGGIVGRKLWNPRNAGGVLWIISRRSVEQRKAKIVAAEKAGKKTGLRKFVAKKA